MSLWPDFSGLQEVAALKVTRWLEGINQVISDHSEPGPSAYRVYQEQEAGMPWKASVPAEKPFERVFRERILQIAQNQDHFLRDTEESKNVDVSAAISATAGAVLEVDPALRQLRFNLVPKHITEEVFWRRYFGAVARIKQEVVTTETVSDDDQEMVHVPYYPECSVGDAAEERSLQGQWLGQAPMDTAQQAVSSIAEHLALSGHSEASHAAGSGGGCASADGDAVGRYRGAASRQRQPDGYANSQASSLTDGMMMSPRSLVSGTVASPLSPTQDGSGGAPHATYFQGGKVEASAATKAAAVVVAASQLRRLADTLAAARQAGSVAEMEARRVSPARAHTESRAGIGQRSRSMRTLVHSRHPSRPPQAKAACMEDLSNKVAEAVWGLFDPMAACHGRQPTPRQSPAASPGEWNAAEAIGRVTPGGLVAQLAVAASKMDTVGEMAQLWDEVVQELRWHWSSGRAVPAVAGSPAPDAALCSLHRRLALLNCCIARRRRQEQFLRLSQHDDAGSMGHAARLPDGSLAMRLGVLRPAEGLFMQDSGEPIYVPQLQEGALSLDDILGHPATDGVAKLNCTHQQQLASDMSAFKAANPGSVLVDFAKWSAMRSEEVDADCEHAGWAELWAAIEVVPASKQPPLFDAARAGEEVLKAIAAMPPVEMFEQLFIAGAGICLAGAAASPLLEGNPQLRISLQEVTAFAAGACRPGMTQAQVTKTCQVMDRLEEMFHVAHTQRQLEQQQLAQRSAAPWEPTSRAEEDEEEEEEGDDDYEEWLLL